MLAEGFLEYIKSVGQRLIPETLPAVKGLLLEGKRAIYARSVVYSL